VQSKLSRESLQTSGTQELSMPNAVGEDTRSVPDEPSQLMALRAMLAIS
jgi:hypothetical protein